MKSKLGIVGLFCSALAGFAQTTESPSVVPVGEFWIESDIAVWSRVDRDNRQFDATATIFTYGIAENWDGQFTWSGWTTSTARTELGATESTAGWGDIGLRAKWNFAGDESTEPAWALLPYVKIPTANRTVGNGKFESGAAIVYGQPLGDEMWLEAMLALDWLSDGAGGRNAAWFGSAVWGHRSGWYGEVLLEHEPETYTGTLPASVGVGYSRELKRGFTIDIEILCGLGNASTEVSGVVRLTWVGGNLGTGHSEIRAADFRN